VVGQQSLKKFENSEKFMKHVSRGRQLERLNSSDQRQGAGIGDDLVAVKDPMALSGDAEPKGRKFSDETIVPGVAERGKGAKALEMLISESGSVTSGKASLEIPWDLAKVVQEKSKHEALRAFRNCRPFAAFLCVWPSEIFIINACICQQGGQVFRE
jgi:hypothetical protein